MAIISAINESWSNRRKDNARDVYIDWIQSTTFLAVLACNANET